MTKLLEFIQDNSTLFLGVIGISISYWFSNSAKKRENDKMMKELFKDFNDRYDALNNKLYLAIEPRTDLDSAKSTFFMGELEKESIIIDYFNLCAEEYFWYKKGRIDSKVWISWSSGMNYWYNHPNGIVKNLWEKEMRKKDGPQSYYINNGGEFFKDVKKND